jgi:hypothetical protein
MRLALLALLGLATAVRVEEAMNPVRRIVNLLQKCQKEAQVEGERDEELHSKFMCYCKKGAGALNKEIGANADMAKQQAAEAEAKAARVEQLKQEVAQHKSDRSDAKQAIAEAEAMRSKEKEAFDKAAGDLGQNVAALGKAISALGKGMGSAKAFLQGSSGRSEQLKRIVSSALSTPESEKQTVLSFLASPYGDYQAASGEIVGILKAMKDEMEKDLGTTLSDEKAAVKAFTELRAAKEAEIAAATKAIEEKSVRSGELAVEATEAKNGAANAANEADADRKFLAELGKNCKTKEEEYEARKKERNQEILAISEALKILNDDDALDIFKKTLPTPRATALDQSFIQTTENLENRRITAMAQISALASVSPKHTRLSLLAYMLKVGKVDFTKVIKMIDDMVAQLKQEQKDDDEHLNWCNAEFESTKDEKAAQEAKIKDLTANIDDLDARIKQLTEEMKTIDDDMEATRKNMEDATEQRKKENAAFKQNMVELTAATQLLAKAKNRLQKFYNPALYKPPPQRELTEEERIAQNMGEEIAPAPQKFIAGTKIALDLSQKVDIGEAPETGKFEKRSGKSSGIMQLMDMLTKDLASQMQEAEHDEKIAQRDYESLMADAKKALQDGQLSLTQKEGERAEAKTNKATAENDRKATNDELMATNEEIASLHQSCDFLVQNFDFRQASRAREIDGLANAKAVLSGANYE